MSAESSEYSARVSAECRQDAETTHEHSLARQAAEDEVHGPIHWLVDASKGPYRLSWLQSSGLFNLRVIHLVKDPRAFVYSMTKPYLPNAWRQTVRMTGRWLVENFIFSRLCRRAFIDKQVFFLRYEDLASKPHGCLGGLATWLGLEFTTTMVEDFRKYKNHGISGNETRWHNTGLHLDERWRNALPRSYERAIWTVTSLLARRYGYD